MRFNSKRGQAPFRKIFLNNFIKRGLTPFGLLILLLFLLVPAAFSAQNSELSSLIEKGELLVKQENYPAGIAIYETVLEKDPKNVKALNALLAACDTYSQKLITQSRFTQAQTYMTKMEGALAKLDAIPDSELSNTDLKSHSRIKREMVSAKGFLLSRNSEVGKDIVQLNQGREQYNQAVKYFEEHQYDIAKELLEGSVKLDGANPYAFELLGEIANLNHDLDGAEKHFKKAFSISPDQRLREKYEKVLREKNIDKDQQHYADEHFIIRYKRNESLDAAKIRDFLRDAYRTISQEFGHYPSYKIPVVLYDRDEYEKLMGSVPHWSGALFDGKIRLPVYQGFISEKELKKLIYHELAHAFIIDLSQFKCPTWLNEGLAQHQENKITPINLQPLAAAVRSKALVPVEDLLYKDSMKITSQSEAVLYYLEAFSFASYVLGQNRFYNMKQLLIELGKGKPFPDSFEKAFGRSLKDYSGEWRKHLEAKYR